MIGGSQPLWKNGSEIAIDVRPDQCIKCMGDVAVFVVAGTDTAAEFVAPSVMD